MNTHEKESAPSRWKFLIFSVIVVGIGLTTRSHPQWYPSLISKYGGDTLWAINLFLFLRFLLPSISWKKMAGIALLGSYLVEVSQLYQAPWINEIRRHLIGRLVLGSGFLWSDIVCYSVGIGIVVIAGWVLEKRQRKGSSYV